MQPLQIEDDNLVVRHQRERKLKVVRLQNKFEKITRKQIRDRGLDQEESKLHSADEVREDLIEIGLATAEQELKAAEKAIEAQCVPNRPVVRPTGPLHLKYRPQAWDEVRGNRVTVRGLKASLCKSETIRPHVFLLTGPSGCGKTTLAGLIANEVGCNSVCFHEINAADTRGVDTIRRMISQSRFVPLLGDVTVYLFDEAQQLTSEAQNALLKISEEPPKTLIHYLLRNRAGKNH